MPTIPVYNQGQGSAVQLATGSLSPRADVGAFVAPGQAMAQLASSAGDIAFRFGMAEREREDERVIAEETANAFEAANQFVLNDKSTTTTEAKDKFNVFRNDLLSGIDEKNYGSRRAGLVKNNLSKILSEQLVQAQRYAYDRGNDLARKALDTHIANELNTLNTIDPNDSMFQFRADVLRDRVLSQGEKGINSSINIFGIDAEIEKIRTNGYRSGHQTLIENAQTPEAVDELMSQIDDLPVDSQSQTVLRQLGEQRKIEIENEIVDEFVSYIDISNVGKGVFDTVDSIQAQVDAANKGDFGANKELEEKWASLTDNQKLKIRDGWEKQISQARNDANFNIQRQAKVERDTNEAIFLENKQLILGGELTIDSIRGLPFQGVAGDALKSQLVDLAGRRANGEILTTSNALIYKETKALVTTGFITSISEPYVVYSDSEETKAANNGTGKSLIERLGDSISDSDFNDFDQRIRLRTSALTSEDDQKRQRDLGRFDTFLTDIEPAIKGGDLLSFTSGPLEKRWYDFTQQMRIRFVEGLENGIPADDLLNPRKPDTYIIRPDENWTPSMQEQMDALTESLSPTPELTLQQVGPPPRQAGQSVVDWMSSQEYIDWQRSDKYPKYLELTK